MSRIKRSPEYEKLDAEITELTFQRAFPTLKLGQTEWEELQAKIEKKTQERNGLLAKETLDIR